MGYRNKEDASKNHKKWAFNNKEKLREYHKLWHLKHYIKRGYHANSGTFKKGFVFPDGIREKMGLNRRGIKFSDEARKNMSLAQMGHHPCLATIEKMRLANLGKKQSQETIEKRRAKLKGQKRSDEFKKQARERIRGEKHPRWISDRTVVVRQERNDPAYQQWRKQVWLRDGFKCKIANQDCAGRIEAHHILVWRDYPELRYNINNGITLCHAHHPRKMALEKKLAPIFQELIKV